MMITGKEDIIQALMEAYLMEKELKIEYLRNLRERLFEMRYKSL